MRRTIWVLLGCLAIALAACGANRSTMDSILDHPLIDRRIEETPRQKIVRECRHEAERFHAGCKSCHTTDDEAQIQGPEKYLLTKEGHRARIMRKSPSFGLHQQCNKCHMSKFQLTVHAQRMFGPKGKYFRELEEAQQSNPVR